ncbi:MAG: ABC transporter ATP-binding protein [Chthoniobacterales bacterium]|nr:ABC transporter ATP-binding protein [Chthoniobacterales bacterium]
MQSNYCLETTDVCYQYASGDVVLRRVNLRVPQGSIYAFLGPNGAGKTTTLRLILGLLKVQQGQITIFGKSLVKDRIEILRRIGSLIESPSLYDHLTASENLAVWQKIYRCSESRIREVLELVGLPNTGGKRAGRFSLGMKQRLSIAVALLHSPSLLILDEPTNGLDPHGMIEIRELLATLNRERGVTIVVSSHLLAEIEKLATHLGIIHRGEVVFQGTMDDLREQRQQVAAVCFSTINDEKALGIISRHIPGARRENGKIVVPPISDEQIARVNQALVEGRVDVHQIAVRRNDLETVFMNLVAEGSR